MQDRLYAGQSLPVNGSLTSANGQHTLILQGDGNLVLYRVKDHVARWATATDGQQVDIAEMQGDGNFVMYGPGHSYVWDSATDQRPGAFLVLQDDGNLVIYDGNGAPLWSSDTWIASASVDGFLPSRNAFHFSNSGIPSCPLFTIQPPIPYGNISIPIGNASNGLCGGMVFATRDMFEAGLQPPATSSNSVLCNGGPMFSFLVNRLIDSFNLPGGIANYMWLMDPALPDHETVASKIGFAPHGRTWKMVHEEWPRIKQDIDNNQLCPLALVQVKTLDPTQLGKNHVVLVYGYEVDGTDLTLKVYDPNFPNEDNVVIQLSIADPTRTITVSRSHGSHPIFCFFRLGYGFESPDFVFEDGSVVREQSAPDVNVIFGNRKFWIPSPAILETFYGGWSNVRVLPDGKLSSLDPLPVEGTVLQEHNRPEVYVISAKRKCHVTSPDVLARYGGWAMVRKVPDGSLNTIPTGSPVY
ncbi:hypothetical protein F0L74_16190 [Chitinophaga agrisoli]|uniref:Bulb-type lectin domain-containing protein n=1 Tax=Chitinophaga agrisoli TaxID=2607653 RepID=A0A5B2VTK3_9BACT|nr:hypothetical protein [Chitinophaga agrisoli]KAA2241439.1 hypothetical protein F0L74_16190 [Chitinophaga agrisoli]